jgi:hypothetical protein
MTKRIKTVCQTAEEGQRMTNGTLQQESEERSRAKVIGEARAPKSLLGGKVPVRTRCYVYLDGRNAFLV